MGTNPADVADIARQNEKLVMLACIEQGTPKRVAQVAFGRSLTQDELILFVRRQIQREHLKSFPIDGKFGFSDEELVSLPPSMDDEIVTAHREIGRTPPKVIWDRLTAEQQFVHITAYLEAPANWPYRQGWLMLILSSAVARQDVAVVSAAKQLILNGADIETMRIVPDWVGLTRGDYDVVANRLLLGYLGFTNFLEVVWEREKKFPISGRVCVQPFPLTQEEIDELVLTRYHIDALTSETFSQMVKVSSYDVRMGIVERELKNGSHVSWNILGSLNEDDIRRIFQKILGKSKTWRYEILHLVMFAQAHEFVGDLINARDRRRFVRMIVEFNNDKESNSAYEESLIWLARTGLERNMLILVRRHMIEVGSLFSIEMAELTGRPITDAEYDTVARSCMDNGRSVDLIQLANTLGRLLTDVQIKRIVEHSTSCQFK